MLDNFHKLTKKIFITKRQQCFSLVLNDGAMVKNLNLLQRGERFKSSYVKCLPRLHRLSNDTCQPLIG